MPGKSRTRSDTKDMSPHATKKHKSNAVNGKNGNDNANQVMMTRSASNNYKRQPTVERRSALKNPNSRKSNHVDFDSKYTYVIDRIYSPQGPISEEEKEKIIKKIRKDGLTCNEENIHNIHSKEFKSQFFTNDKDLQAALKEKRDETLPFSRWSIDNVNNNHDNKWHTTLGKVCLYGGLFILGHVIAKSIAGKKKSKKTKTRKITRK